MGHVFVQRRLASTGPVATCGYTYSSAEPWSQMLREEVQEVSHTGRQCGQCRNEFRFLSDGPLDRLVGAEEGRVEIPKIRLPAEEVK